MENNEPNLSCNIKKILKYLPYVADLQPDILQHQYRCLTNKLKVDVTYLEAKMKRLEKPLDITVLKTVFGDFSKNHMFQTDPLDWHWKLREVDVTHTFVQFLNHIEKAARIEAFLKALGVNNLPDQCCLSKSKAEAEVLTKTGKRLDILITVPLDNKSLFIAVEAKLGHHITTGQLPSYKNHIRENPDYHHDSHLVVLGLRNDKKTRTAIKQNSDWRFQTWFDFLLKFEKLLYECAEKKTADSLGADDPRFQLFRSTLWEKIDV